MPKQTTVKKSSSTKNKPTATKKKRPLLPKLLLRQWIGLGLAGLAVFSLSWIVYSHTTQSATTTQKLQVTATFYPLYDFARMVGGQLAEVRNATPPGADAHDFEPSPQDLVAAYQSDLFIYHQKSMEPWVAKFLTDYKHTALGIVEHLDLQDHHDHQSDHHHEHDHSQDPHLWTDPVLAQEIVEAIAHAYVAADPANEAIYRANANNFIAQLKQLDQQFSQGLASCQQRTIVTSHAAFAFLAERYNLQVLPISGLSPEQEPSASKLAELKSIIKQQNISTVFFENQASQRLAQTLASETGLQTSILNPIESLPQSAIDEGQDYLSVQRSNLANLRHALACR